MDARSEQLFTIDTTQGDSEVLLIEDGTVYYRASHRLYSAPITEKGIGASRLLAISTLFATRIGQLKTIVGDLLVNGDGSYRIVQRSNPPG